VQHNHPARPLTSMRSMPISDRAGRNDSNRREAMNSGSSAASASPPPTAPPPPTCEDGGDALAEAAP